MDANPCDKIKEVKVVDEPPAILSVEALTALLYQPVEWCTARYRGY